MNQQNLLVFTDMDGSLLDHHTYSHAAADKLLQALESKNVPVIANTSKTRAELEALRKDLNNRHPFIAENGAAVFLPKDIFIKQPEGTKSDGKYWVKAFSAPRAHWQALIDDVSGTFSDYFRTFEQAGIEGIVEMTGLDLASATRAADREYGEPIKWLGPEDQSGEFFRLLEARGAQILHGGRFNHVSGHCDKGIALRWLKRCYEKHLNQNSPLKTLALGDSQNDIAMLDASDYAVVIKSPVHAAPKLHTEMDKRKHRRIYDSKSCGPEGWAEGVDKILTILDTHTNEGT